MIPICPAHPTLNNATEQLAQQWGFEFCSTTTADYFLELTQEHLQLVQNIDKSVGPIFVDFTAGAVHHRRLYGGGKGQMIAKAVALNKLSNPTILDATAGLGRDAFIFASLGAKVIMIERSAIACALLSDGLQRARHAVMNLETTENVELSDIINRMTLLSGDSCELMKDFKQSLKNAHIAPQKPNVIYLDPMFPHRKKSAKVKKEMLAFQTLIGIDQDSEQLLEASLRLATHRVVVKRPIKAKNISERKPSLVFKMKKHRFDIYLTGT